MFELQHRSRQNGSILEHVPLSVVESSLRNFRRTAFGSAVTFSALWTITMVIADDVSSGSAILGGLFLFIGGLAFAYGVSAAMRHQLFRQIPTTELKRDSITVRYGKHVIRANIQECRFRRGYACRSRLPGAPRLHCYQPVILIYFPSRSWKTKTAWQLGARLRVPVGFTEAMRGDWERAILSAS